MVGGPKDEPAAAADRVEAKADLVVDILRGHEGQRVLLVHAAPEEEAVAILALQPGRVHTGRLDRVEDVDADLG